MSSEKLNELGKKAHELRRKLEKIENEIEAIAHSKTYLIFTNHQLDSQFASFLHPHYVSFETEIGDNWFTLLNGDVIGRNKSLNQFWEYLYRTGVVDKEHIPISNMHQFSAAVHMVAYEIHTRPYHRLEEPRYIHE